MAGAGYAARPRLTQDRMPAPRPPPPAPGWPVACRLVCACYAVRMLQPGLTFVSAFAQFSDGVALIDLDLRFRDANRALWRWLSHVSVPEAGVGTLPDLLHPEDLPGQLRAVSDVLGGARQEAAFVVRLHPGRGAGGCR